MRKLIVATMAAAGVLAATAPLAGAATIVKTGPPGTIIKGSIGNCKWKLQGGEQRGKVAYTHLWYLGPQCTQGGFEAVDLWDPRGGKADLATCSFNVACDIPSNGRVKQGRLRTKTGELVLTSVANRKWERSDAVVCGVVPGIDQACDNVHLSRGA